MQVPHIFSPGFPARSAEVNENFKALADAITALEERLANVEGTFPFPGTYFLMGFQTGLMPFGQTAVIEGIVYTGTVVLHPGATPGGGGSATFTLREAKNELHLTPNGNSRRFVDATEPFEGSWSINPGTGLQLHVPDNPRPLRFARTGSRLLVGNHLNADDGSSVMLFLVRQPG